MARRRRRSGGATGFSAALRCLIRPWRALEPWIAHDDEVDRTSRHPAARLGDVLQQRRESVTQKGTFDGYAPITVHLDGGISVRRRDAVFKGQMFAAYPGDVVFSKIDARNGAIGVLPATIPAAVVTSEFPVFTAHPDSISARYLELVLRAGGFIDALRRKATGTSGRKRITPDAFRALSIPLPPIEEQRALVAAHDAAVGAADALEAEAAETERGAAADFADALGLAAPPPLPERPMFVAAFRDLERWSHESVLRRVTAGDAGEAKWPVARLGDVIADLENGWSPKCHGRPAADGEWGVLKLGAITGGRYEETENKTLPATATPREKLEVRAGDVLIARGSGQTRLVGAACFVPETRFHLMMCDLIFRVLFREESDIDPAFLTEVLKTETLRHQIEDRRTGAAPMMQKVTKPALLALALPLPPLETQIELVAALAGARAKAAGLREQARDARAAARAAFEAAIYA